jgi:hypothetical protein
MQSNDWGDTQDIADDKWEDFSSAPTESAAVLSTENSWIKDKSSSSQVNNDWDTDAFFNDVLSTASKPKLKTTRR